MNERLKQLRKALKSTQKEFAARLGTSWKRVSEWENGARGLTVSRICQICAEFNVRREWLEHGEGEMFEPESKPKSDQETLEDAALALFNRLDATAQEAVMNVLMRLLNEARERYKAKAKPEEPGKNATATEPILVAEKRKGDGFTA